MALFLLLPLVPHFPEWATINLLELPSEEGAAVGCSVIEADELVIAIFCHQVVHEPCTVKVGVGTHLKVHRRAFRLEADHRKQLVVLVDDATEVHLVIAAKSTAHTVAQPRFHKAGDTLVIPARAIPAWHTQIAPQGRNGMTLVGTHLGTEELAPIQVTAVILIRHHNVCVLVVKELSVALN